MEGRKNNWLGKLVSTTYSGIVSYIFFVIIMALMYLAVFSTSYVNQPEKIFFLPDNPLLNISFFAIVLLLVAVGTKISAGAGKGFFVRLETEDSYFKK